MVGQTLVPLKNREKHTQLYSPITVFIPNYHTNQLKYFLPSNNNNKTIFFTTNQEND
jgi:hypothetical protein